MGLSRRDFLLLSASAAAVLAYRSAYAQGLRRRKEISTLSATELTSYRAGVTAMKALARDNPLSWDYQRAVHRIDPSGSALNPLPDPPGVANYWRQCRHGNPHFFSWHRWELLYWEEMCRQLSGDTTFNLPYWDWMANGFLPNALRAPASGTNPLFHGNRNTLFNAGTAQLNDLGNTLALNGFSSTDFLNFSGQFEGNPHGTVHVSIGGDMQDPDTAALDPIFFLHHANIDRYWVEWLRQGGGRANPTGSWLAQPFDFQSTSGPKTPIAGNAVTTEELEYTYDKQRIVPPKTDILKWLKGLRLQFKFPKPRGIPVPPHPPGPGPDPAPWIAMTALGGFEVDGFPTIVPVPKDGESASALHQALVERNARVSVALQGIQIKQSARKDGFIVQMFLVPSEKELVADRLNAIAEIGSLTSFNVLAVSGHKHHASDDQVPRVVMSDAAKALLAASLDKDPAILLMRRSPLKDKAGKELPFDPKETLFSVDSLRIDVQKAAR